MKIAIIPARGGSKRIPRKNIKIFGGKPIIAWSISAAKKSGLFDQIIVSTDDNEIAEIAKQYGAEVPFIRAENLSNDYAGTSDVISQATEWMINEGCCLEAVCCIYATAPLIQINDLIDGFNLLEAGDLDFVFSATDFSSSIYRSFKSDKKGISMIFPENYSKRSQDFPDVFHDAGQFYWGRPKAWLKKKNIFHEKSKIVPIPRWRVQDIDTIDDWRRAELIFKMMINEGVIDV